jgi:hypothetical protein
MPVTGWPRRASSVSSNGGVCGSARLHNPLSDSAFTLLTGEATFFSGGGQFLGTTFTGQYRSTAAVNAFRLLFSSGNIAGGTVRAYGVPKS